MNNEKPKVSVVIIPYDNINFFERTAKSILENTDYVNFEVIASHNPCLSEKVNLEMLGLINSFRSNYENFKYIINETNLYHAKGSMSGFQVADKESKYIVLANDDIFIPAPQMNWLEILVNFMEENPQAASVTPCLLYPKETIYWIGKQDPNQPQHDFLHMPRGDSRLPTKPLTTVYNNMACCLTRRYLLEEIPLGQSCSHYGSDSEFANRIKDNYPEMNHYVIPEIKLYHWNIFASRDNHGKDKIVEG